jgi:hypothetical protein
MTKEIAVASEVIGETTIGDWINQLAAFHSRHSQPISLDQVATWLKTRLQGLG